MTEYLNYHEIRVAALNAAVHRSTSEKLYVQSAEEIVFTADIFENYIKNGYRAEHFL